MPTKIFTIEVEKALAAKMAQLSGQLNERARALMEQATKDLAEATYYRGRELAFSKLDSTAPIFADALKFDTVAPGVYVVSLAEEAHHLENGYCVLFNPRRSARYQPKVYTIDGWRPITEIKEGDLVLNQHGQFTSVMKVHVRAFLSAPVEAEKIGRRTSPHGTRDVYRYVCRECGWEKESSRIERPRKCGACGEKEYVEIEVMPRHPLKLTPEHEVLTKRGWIQAKDLRETDLVAWTSGNLCENCGRPSQERYCTKSCAAATNNRKLVRQGRHPSQLAHEAFRKRYLNNLKLARKQSGLVSHFLKELNWSDGYEREHPVKCVRANGKKTCFWLDVYFPEHRLAFELDGTAFHNQGRDAERDRLIKEQHDIDIIRITDKEWKKNRKACTERALRALGNHSGAFAQLIEFRPLKKLRKLKVTNGFNLTHRWDITVASGESFVCQGAVIHNSGFDMKPGLLNKATKRSKLGYRYRSIPFEHKTTGKPKKGSGSGDMLSDLRRIRAAFGDKGITKTASGQDMLGKIFSVRPDDLGNWNLRGAQPGVGDQNVRFANGQPSQNLAGVVKYQWQQQLRNGGVRTRTSFMTFRTVSENPKYANKWRHPGFAGVKIMDELADWAAQQLPKLFEDIFSRS
jgi:hypothetical protein